jgi:hypothetical protein
MFFDRGTHGPFRPTQGDKNGKQNCHPDRSVAKWRDLLFYSAVSEMFFDRGVMGLRPIQGNEKRLSFQQLLSMEAPPSPLSSRAKPRDLRFSGPLLDMFFDRGIMGLRPTQGNEKTASIRQQLSMELE